MIGRKRRATVGTYVEAPLAPLAPIERVVEEGALIYISSARMAVKNQIIVAALGKHLDYEPGALRDAVRMELDRLADDNDETADRLETTAAGTAEHESTLDEQLVLQKREDQRRRPRVLRMIAEHLRELALSDAEVESLVEQARAQAVDEMFHAINTRLAHGAVEADAGYAAGREQRISDFVAFDLLGAKEPGAPAAPTERPARRSKRARD